MLFYPDRPAVPPDQQIETPLTMRYEDVCQDGRVLLGPVAQVVTRLVWSRLLCDHPITTIARRQLGMIPVLSRLTVVGGDGPVSAANLVQASGCYQLAHSVDATGAVDRLYLNVWVEVFAKAAHTHGPQPANHGQRIFVGKAFAEHIFTRPCAPQAHRQVRDFANIYGLPTVPQTHYQPTSTQLYQLPHGAAPLEDDLLADVAQLPFGLAHTDGNQHVSSLVYPRKFEEAALRRLVALGLPPRVLPRYLDIAFRKPCFAGDRMRIALRAFTIQDRSGVVGCFVPDPGCGPIAGDAHRQPHCAARMLFCE